MAENRNDPLGCVGDEQPRMRAIVDSIGRQYAEKTTGRVKVTIALTVEIGDKTFNAEETYEFTPVEQAKAG